MTQAQEFDIEKIKARDPQYAAALREHPIHYAVQQKQTHPPFRHFEVVAPGGTPESIARDGIVSGTVVMLDCDVRESCAIPGSDGEELFRLEPCEATPAAVYAPRSLYGLVLAGIGAVAGDVERSNRWRAEGEKWAKACLGSAPRDAFEEFTHTRAVFLSMVKDRLVNSFGLIVEAADEIIGEPSELPARSLWAGQAAARLAEAARVQEEAAKAAEAAAKIVAAEVARPKTIEEVGIVVFEVPADHPSAGDAGPWQDATVLWTRDGKRYPGFRKLIGLPPPTYADASLRVCDASEIVPPSCSAIPEANASALQFVRWMVARYAKGVDLGPVDASRWTTEGLARARELAAQFAPVFLDATKAYLWSHFCEVLVRGLLIYPPQAERLIALAMRTEEIKRNPPFKIPSQFAERERAIEGRDFAQPETATREIARIDPSAPVPMDPTIASLVLAAARGGSVSTACLLPSATTLTPKHTKKAGK